MKELLYRFKRKCNKLYKKYFTIDYPETYILSDKSFVKKMYEAKMGRKLDFKNPKTFTEKVNWLKIYDRRPEYTKMADKFTAREYIAERIGSDTLVPLLGVWDDANDIDFSLLPNKFVLKCNHNSDVTICTDKSKLDELATKEKHNNQLKDDYYLHKREWPYKNIPRKIICEKFLENNDGSQLLEYNVFCFNGIPRFFKVGTRTDSGDLIKSFYDLDWNLMDLSTGNMAGDIFGKPVFFEKMLELSKILSENVPHLRVDFLVCNNKLYSGELTFFSAGGFWKLTPEDWDNKFGEFLTLPKKRRR